MSQQQRQDFEKQLRDGVQAAQQGDAENARILLETCLRQDRNNRLGYNELAWIWMASIVETQKERRLCLQKVIEINPENVQAREAINSLIGVIGSTDTIDYREIVRGAKAKMPADRTMRPRSEKEENNNRIILMVVAALVIGLLLISSLVLPGIISPEPTATPLPTNTSIARIPPTFTPLPPTITPEIQSVSGESVTRPTDLPFPTNTPTITPLPTETPIPTATLPPLVDMTVYLVADGDADTSVMYRAIADGTGVQRVLDNFIIADVNPDANLIAFTRLAIQSDGAPALIQAFIGPLSDPTSAVQATRLESGTIDALSISPDGAFLAYTSTEDGDPELYLLNLQNGIITQLTDNNFIDTDPSWSADGASILFTSDRDSLGRNDIYIYTRADSDIKQLIDTGGIASSPRFSPDGSQVLYIDGRSSSETSVYVASVDGSRVRQLRYAASSRVSSPVWSADGRFIAFIAKYGERGDDVVFMTPDNTTTQPIFIAEAASLRSIVVR